MQSDNDLDLSLSNYFVRIRLQFTLGSLLPAVWIPIFTWPYANPRRLVFFAIVLVVLVALQGLVSFRRLGPKRNDADGLPILAAPAIIASQIWTGSVVVIDFASAADLTFILFTAVVLFSAAAGTVFTLGPIRRLAQGALVGLLLPGAVVASLQAHVLFGLAYLSFLGLVAFSVVPQISSWFRELIELRVEAAAQGERDRVRATTDELTSVLNRRGVGERFHNDPSRYGWLLYIDLDRFKVINDSGGHLVGDKMLIQIARRLQTAVPDGGVIGRIGGDEFLVLVPAEGVDPDELVASLVTSLTRPVAIDGRSWTVGASVGIAPTGGGRSFESIVHAADVEMFAMKSLLRPPDGAGSRPAPGTIPPVPGRDVHLL